VGRLAAPRLRAGDPLLLPPRRPRVLAINLDELEGDRLARVQATAAGALIEAGYFAAEGRPFLAHVTVARVAARLPRSLDLSPPDPAPFTADRVTLFRARLGSGPARYEPLQTVVLAG
jgi:2'-5' RNA ligase